MPIIAAESPRKEFHLVPADTHQAVCHGVWDIGLQKSKFGEETKIQHKIIVGWETAETIPTGEYQGKRYTIYKRYTLSLSDKATLNKDLTSWRGRAFTDEEKKGFDVEKLIGVNCLIGVVHNGVGEKTYANVATVSKIPKGMPTMAPENPPTTPDWIRKLQDQAVKPVHEEEADEVMSESEEETVPF